MRVVYSFIVSAIIFLSVGVLSTVWAATLIFNPSTATVKKDDTFQVSVNVNTGTEKVAASDAYIIYDPALVEPQSITAGTYFKVVTNVIRSGVVYISGLTPPTDTGPTPQYPSGNGTIATVVFKALQSGTGTLRFNCNLTKEDSSTVVRSDVNGTNLIECNALTAFNYTVSGPTGTPGPSPTGGAAQPTNPPAAQYQPPAALPASGILESVTQYSFIGFVLLMVSLFLKISVRLYYRR